MSSHHFVRDGQEPALIIMDTNSLDWKSIQSLLEWNPIVLTFEVQLEKVISWGIKIDVVICQAQNKSKLMASLTEHHPVNCVEQELENSPLQTALHFLMQREHVAVNVIGTFRLCHEVLEGALLANEQTAVVLYDTGYRWVFVKEGRFEKWAAKGTLFKIRSTQGHLTWKEQSGLESLESTTQDQFSTSVLGSLGEGTIYLETKGNQAFWLGEHIS